MAEMKPLTTLYTKPPRRWSLTPGHDDVRSNRLTWPMPYLAPLRSPATSDNSTRELFATANNDSTRQLFTTIEEEDVELDDVAGQSTDKLAEIAARLAQLEYRQRLQEQRRTAASAAAVPTPATSGPLGEKPKTLQTVTWRDRDPENPHNWSSARKAFVLATALCLVLNSTLASALPSQAIPFFTREWGIESDVQKVLPISVFMLGYVFGPLLWGPVSEQIGRRYLSMCTFAVFAVFTMACALSTGWVSFLVFRAFAGFFASAALATVPGIMADIFNTKKGRGAAFALFVTINLFGPLIAPVVSGFCSPLIGWRWTFWVDLIFIGASSIALIFLPETFAPKLLTRRAVKMRKADPRCNAYAAAELGNVDIKKRLSVVLVRPARMLATEAIAACACLYLSLCYGIFYMSFQAYPIIFAGVYHLSPGVTGLCFLPVGAGALIALPLFFSWNAYLAGAMERGEAWTRKEEFRRLPLACLGGPMFVISLFWLGWTARPSIPFVVPMMAGILFGAGFMLIFMALLNYLTDAYDVYAASANAAASASRSILAVVLPFSTGPMFRALNISGACTLLGGLSALMCFIPFIFIWKSDQIRARSTLFTELQALKEGKGREAINTYREIRATRAPRSATAAEWPLRKTQLQWAPQVNVPAVGSGIRPDSDATRSGRFNREYPVLQTPRELDGRRWHVESEERRFRTDRRQSALGKLTGDAADNAAAREEKRRTLKNKKRGLWRK